MSRLHITKNFYSLYYDFLSKNNYAENKYKIMRNLNLAFIYYDYCKILARFDEENRSSNVRFPPKQVMLNILLKKHGIDDKVESRHLKKSYDNANRIYEKYYVKTDKIPFYAIDYIKRMGG